MTERGAQVHEERQQRSLVAVLIDRMSRAREAAAAITTRHSIIVQKIHIVSRSV